MFLCAAGGWNHSIVSRVSGHTAISKGHITAHSNENSNRLIISLHRTSKRSEGTSVCLCVCVCVCV